MDEMIVANTILRKAHEENIPIIPMKLQKMLYLFYREYLKTTNTPAFATRFEAWKRGPVISKIHDYFKRYGTKPIDGYYIDCNKKALVYNTDKKSPFSIAFNKVWNKYKDYSAVQLSKMTCQEGSAWETAVKRRDLFLCDEDIINEKWE